MDGDDAETLLKSATDANLAETALALFRGGNLFEAARRGAQYALTAEAWDALSYYADFLRDVARGDIRETESSAHNEDQPVSLAMFIVPL